MKKICAKCKSRKTCTELCDVAEQYVNADYVPQSEFLVSDPILTDGDDVWNLLNFENKKILEEALMRLVEDGKSTNEIAYHLPISKRHIRRLKRKLTHHKADIQTTT